MLSSLMPIALLCLSLTVATPIPAPGLGAEPIARAIDTLLLETRQSGCSAYTLINTRGTGERQGPSSGFTTMNRNVLAAKPGGTVYSTVYPASFSQNSASGTTDILRQIDSTLSRDPDHCFILQGYSQGAAATCNALDRIPSTDTARFRAVRGVFLIGNPEHRAGLACNVDTNGGTTTRNVNGISGRFGGGVPDAWVSKTLDVCNRVGAAIQAISRRLALTNAGRRSLRYNQRSGHQRSSPRVSTGRRHSATRHRLHPRSSQRLREFWRAHVSKTAIDWGDVSCLVSPRSLPRCI